MRKYCLCLRGAGEAASVWCRVGELNGCALVVPGALVLVRFSGELLVLSG